MKQKIFLLILLMVAVIAGKLIWRNYKSTQPIPEQIMPLKTFTYQQIATHELKPQTTSTAPIEFSLKVPFTPQAPTANWDELHNEGCEEASAIMAAAFFNGDTRAVIPPNEVEKEFNKLTEWQDKNFGYHLDATAAETAKMITDFYHLKTKLINDFTESDIKQEIVSGNIVIVPENGRLLGNPYYKTPGPIYHMLIIKGYTATKLITNDSGTKRGQNYVYDFATIKNAGVDWDHSINTIDQNKKVMIVVSK